MRRPSIKNPAVVGVAGMATVAAVSIAALQYDDLPLIGGDATYRAMFADLGGLKPDAEVRIAGVSVGRVSDMDLVGDRVMVSFKVDSDIVVGDRTEAEIKTKTLLGAKYLEVIPRGSAGLTEPIPVERTSSPYQLPDAIGDLTAAISGLDTGQLSESLQTLATTFAETPPSVRPALEGVARLSQSLDTRDQELRTLIQQAQKVGGVLGSRADRIGQLVADSNALLSELLVQSRALDDISGHISAVSQQLSAFVTDNRDTFKPALEKLSGALAMVDNRKDRVQKAIKMINSFALSLGEAISSGPFFKNYLANLLPGQFIQPFVEAAFSDLGLDPNVLLPSERFDPQTGQPATPALPVPYPRTGQGGEPHLTLPDAITGKPGDTRYPYREPVPAPPAGGPPPGPPAQPAEAAAERSTNATGAAQQTAGQS